MQKIGKQKVLTTKEAAENLGVSVESVKKWAQEGFFKNANKIGYTWCIPYEDFIKFKKAYRKWIKWDELRDD